MLGEVIAIVTSACGALIASARFRPARSRTGIWDVARDVVRGHSQRAMERERRVTLLVLADLTRDRHCNQTGELMAPEQDGA